MFVTEIYALVYASCPSVTSRELLKSYETPKDYNLGVRAGF